MSGPSPKFIIGVPVLPGLPAQTGFGKDPEDPIQNTPVEEKAAAGPAPPSLPKEPKWKLRHVDFIPNLVKGTKNEEFERFRTLIEKANMWSQENPQALIFQVETVTWTTMDRPLYSDNSIINKSMHSGKSTKVFRGLRLWYLVLEDTFYDKTTSPGPYKLGFVNYNPENKSDTFEILSVKLNEELSRGAFPGKILKLETLHILAECQDPDICCWKEQPDSNRDYYSFFRIFYMNNKRDESTKYGEIGKGTREQAGTKLGVRDFLPRFDQRTPHNQGYEVFSDMWKRAARWIFLNPHLKLINVQSVFFKLKKEGVDPTAVLYERCYHREHGSAYGSMTHNKTEYIQALRVVFSDRVQKSSGGSADEPKKMFYKSFTPVRLKLPSSPGSSGDEEPLENVYEDLRHTEEKINVWLNHTGAKIFGVESLPTRLVTGGQEMIGPEASFVYNDREKNIGREYWRYNLRIYVEGEFKEIPVHWTATVEEQSTVGVTPH